LSGAPQAQHQNPGQAIWAQRPAQQSQAQRQQQEAQDTPQQGLRQNQQQQQGSNDDSFPSANQFTNNLDDFRPRGQGSSDQPQTGSIDEFPPLGRDSSIPMGNRDSSLEMASERRSSLIQNTGFGAYTNGMAFASMGQQQRNPLANPNLMNRPQEQSRITSPATQGMGCEWKHRHLCEIDLTPYSVIIITISFTSRTKRDDRARQASKS
jgi:CCR4-NOT transcription complex subunit 2